MFGDKFLIRADDRPLEKQPRTLNLVGMHVAPDPLLLVTVDSLMDSIGDELVKCFTYVTVNHLEPSPTPTFCDTYYDYLVVLIAMTKAFGSTTYIGFVNFQNTFPERRRTVRDSSYNPVSKIPSDLARYSYSPLDLVGRYSIFRFYHQIYNSEPSPESKMAVKEDSTSGNVELIAA
jgi:hypothetical protein